MTGMTELETRSDASALVTALADASRRGAAFAALVRLGPNAREAVRAGLGDGRWEVRRWCVYWLLRFAEPGDVTALAPLARDSRSRVRQAALVALAQAPGAGGAAEVSALLIERALTDESLQVRRHVVSLLAWHRAHPDLEGFFAELLATERDAKLRKFAGFGLLRCRGAEKAPETPSC